MFTPTRLRLTVVFASVLVAALLTVHYWIAAAPVIAPITVVALLT